MAVVQAVLWDLDGTLVDSAALHYQAWRQTLQHYGVDYSYPEFIAGFGQSNRSVLSNLIAGIEETKIAAISAAKEMTYRNLLATEGVEPLPGVMTWLESFRAADLIQVISSSGPMANIAATISALPVGDYFRCLLSGAQLPKGKPDPAIFLNSAAAAGIAPAHCLVIEDSVHGVEAARRAGMICIVVGDLAVSPALDTLLAAVDGRPCLPAYSLERLSWQELTALE